MSVPGGSGHATPAYAYRDVMEYRLRNARYSGLMLAARITLPHFSVSSAMNFPSSAGVIGIGTAPMSANCAAIFGSARDTLISMLRLLTISAAVFLGAPIPYQP